MQFLGISKAPLVVFMLPIVACAANNGPLFECSTNPYCVVKDLSVSPMKYVFSPAVQTLGPGTWSCHGINVHPPRSANACCDHPTGYNSKDRRLFSITSDQFFNKFKCAEVPGHY
ncbi:hypothetical protein PGT21_012615 [Puccinia graminis f. sp. tritici]|uniref:Secreted protein n=1 Tax=Puccinia graminis f. sp. tritici TaxID=56615 RepID=A0A5B0LSU0_PUCGR|nr:hypothetical protein PGTUg99_013789 [Puccinia graminis f. sp. tritici]KAA1083958.1 hypothetical protein PGT21_012615 [Puccinia graminis f. sp. tritici]